MGINRFFQLFIPKESKFFPLLRGQVADLMKAADLLIEFSKSNDHEERKKIYTEIKAAETHCDTLTNQVFDELNTTFITPFDREDIHSLASELDDVLDFINGSTKRAILYQPKEMPDEMLHMAEHIKAGCKCLEIAIRELDKLKKSPKIVKEQCDKLHDIERDADGVYETFLIKLFQENENAIELIKQMEIMQGLETATDKAEEVADIIKTMIVKYA